jgi:hypothetical protein
MMRDKNKLYGFIGVLLGTTVILLTGALNLAFLGGNQLALNWLMLSLAALAVIPIMYLFLRILYWSLGWKWNWWKGVHQSEGEEER